MLRTAYLKFSPESVIHLYPLDVCYVQGPEAGTRDIVIEEPSVESRRHAINLTMQSCCQHSHVGEAGKDTYPYLEELGRCFGEGDAGAKI